MFSLQGLVIFCGLIMIIRVIIATISFHFEFETQALALILDFATFSFFVTSFLSKN